MKREGAGFCCGGPTGRDASFSMGSDEKNDDTGGCVALLARSSMRGPGQPGLLAGAPRVYTRDEPKTALTEQPAAKCGTFP